MRHSDEPATAHGLVRTREWEVLEIDDAGEALHIELGLPHIECGLPGWPHDVALTLSIRLDSQLHISLTSHNPDAQGNPRPVQKLCAGQTLLCKALGLKVREWDAKCFEPERLRVDDVGAKPARIIQTTRLGIPHGRDEHLMYRFVDAEYAAYCTRNPLRRGQVEGRDYLIVEPQPSPQPSPTGRGG